MKPDDEAQLARLRRPCNLRHLQMSPVKHWAYHHALACHLCMRYSLNYVLWGVQGKHYRQCHGDYLTFGGEVRG